MNIKESMSTNKIESKRAAIIGFTRSGCGYAHSICLDLQKNGWDCGAYGKCACAGECKVQPVEESLQEWTRGQFACCDALIFVGAAGIAVRSIAPFVASKLSDPAVLCMDEQAHFVISLLSGHVGGANELALQIADRYGAVPVITTATDLHGAFAVDVFAKKQNLFLLEKEIAKEISAAILEGQIVGLYTEFPIQGELPDGLVLYQQKERSDQKDTEMIQSEKAALGICISLDEKKQPFTETLHLVPRVTVLGMGCRKETPAEKLQKFTEQIFGQNHLSFHSLDSLVSIDLKKEEPGLLELAEKWNVPYITYSAEELEKAEKKGGFTESDFVKQITGIGNVCERAALLKAEKTVLLQEKLAEDGMTAAIAIKDYAIRF